jgi:HPt (histidine-containing phosphotransfer) domain-containing protein
MLSELKTYKERGINDYLSKPFTSQGLWHILLNYLKPVGSETIYENEYKQRTEELKNNLRINFVRNSSTIYNEISDAIDSKNIHLAHRLAHTLKGIAGQIGETDLQNAAESVENILKNEILVIPEDTMKLLKTEFTSVIDKLTPLHDEYESNKVKVTLNTQQINDLFDVLEPMLKKGDAKCVKLLPEIQAIPGAEELAIQIERTELRAAYKTLEKVKAKWRNEYQ